MVINNKNKSRVEKVIVQASSVRRVYHCIQSSRSTKVEKVIVQASSVRLTASDDLAGVTIAGEKATVQASSARRPLSSGGLRHRNDGEKAIVQASSVRPSLMPEKIEISISSGKKPSYRLRVHDTWCLGINLGYKPRKKIHRTGIRRARGTLPPLMADVKGKVIVPTSGVRPCCDYPNRLGDCCLEEGGGIVLTLRVRPCVFLILIFSASSRKSHRTEFERTTTMQPQIQVSVPMSEKVIVRNLSVRQPPVKRNSFREVRRVDPPYWLQEYDRFGTPIVMLTGQTRKKSHRTGLTRTNSTIDTFSNGREKSTVLTLCVRRAPKNWSYFWSWIGRRGIVPVLCGRLGNVSSPSLPFYARKEHRAGFMCTTRVDEPKSIVLASGVRSEDRTTKEHRIGFAYTADDRDHTAEIKVTVPSSCVRQYHLGRVFTDPTRKSIVPAPRVRRPQPRRHRRKSIVSAPRIRRPFSGEVVSDFPGKAEGIVPALHVRRDGLLQVIARAMHITKKRNIVPVLSVRRIWSYIDCNCNHKNKEVSYQLYLYDMSTRWFPILRPQSKKRHHTVSTGMKRANGESVRSHQSEEAKDTALVLLVRVRPQDFVIRQNKRHRISPMNTTRIVLLFWSIAHKRKDIVSVLSTRLRLNVTLTVSKILQMKEKKSCLSCEHDCLVQGKSNQKYEEPIKIKHTVLVLGIRRPSPPESTKKEQKGHRTSPMRATQVFGYDHAIYQLNEKTHRIDFLCATYTDVNNEYLQKRGIVPVLFVRLSQVFLFYCSLDSKARNIAPVFCGRRSICIGINRLFVSEKETSHCFYICDLLPKRDIAPVLGVRLGDFDVRSEHTKDRDIVHILGARRARGLFSKQDKRTIVTVSGLRQIALGHPPTDLTSKRYRALFDRSTRVKTRTTFKGKRHRASLKCTALRALFYLDYSDIVRILNARRFGDSATIRNNRDIVQISRARTFDSGSLESSKHRTKRAIVQNLKCATLPGNWFRLCQSSKAREIVWIFSMRPRTPKLNLRSSFWQKRHRTGLICTTVSLSSYEAIIKVLSAVRRPDKEASARRGIVAALSARSSRRRSETYVRGIVPSLTVRPDTPGGPIEDQTPAKETSYQSYLYDKKCTVERRVIRANIKTDQETVFSSSVRSYFYQGHRTDLKYAAGRLDFQEQHPKTVRGIASISRMRLDPASSETSHRPSLVRRLKMFRPKNLWRRGTVPAFGVRRQSHRATLCSLFDKDIARALCVRPGFMSRSYNKLNTKPIASNLDAREKPSHRASLVVRRCFCLFSLRSIALDHIMRQSTSEDIHRSVIVLTSPVRRSSAYPDTKDLSRRLCVCDSSFRDLRSKEGD